MDHGWIHAHPIASWDEPPTQRHALRWDGTAQTQLDTWMNSKRFLDRGAEQQLLERLGELDGLAESTFFDRVINLLLD